LILVNIVGSDGVIGLNGGVVGLNGVIPSENTTASMIIFCLENLLKETLKVCDTSFPYHESVANSTHARCCIYLRDGIASQTGDAVLQTIVITYRGF